MDIIKSFKYASSGVVHAFTNNWNLKFHFVAGIVAIWAGIFFGLDRYEMITVFLLVLIVISTEMLNTAVEEMTNLITTEHRREAKIAKDVAAGMVLVSSIGAVVVGWIIFAPYILPLIGF